MAEQKRKINDDSIKSLFDRFDGTKCSKAVTYLSLRKFKQYPNWDETLVYKVKCLKSFVGLIQNEINIKYAKTLGSRFSIERNLIFYADPNMPTVYAKFRISQNGKNDVIPMSLNIPLEKLIMMPALEVYTILSAAANDVIQKALIGKTSQNAHVDLQKTDSSLDIKKEEQVEKSASDEANKQRAIDLLATYLEGFLAKACGGEFVEFDDISRLVASQIVERLDGKSVEEMLGLFFDFSKFDKEALDKVAIFTEKEVSQLRATKVYEKFTQLSKDPDKELEALNAIQQYNALMSYNLKDQFLNVANNKQGKTSNRVDIENFCRSYADAFMDSNGLKPVPLTFRNEGELGTYIDEGNKQSININFSKIKTTAELVSTLSHELTHAVESSINKTKGDVSKEGFGLENNISSDISMASEALKTLRVDAGGTGIDAYEFLRDLNKYCYRINPNERSARFGELSALKFMGAIADTDIAKTQLVQACESFSIYQSDTINIIQNLSKPEFIAELEAKLALILGSNITAVDKKLLIERMDYIKEIISKKKNLSVAMEQESLREILLKDKNIAKETELDEQVAALMQM